MPTELRLPAPEKPLDLDQVLKRWPVIRQSIAAKLDDCSLSAYFEMRYSGPYSTHPQAAGILFHRFAAEAIREMQRQDSSTIPVGVALAIAEETLAQRGIPAGERVRLPIRMVPLFRMTCAKWARDNSFSIRHVVDVERRVEAPLEYQDDDGELRTRRLSGQLDLLVADPKIDDGAIIIDWKNTWALPPEKQSNDPEDGGVSYHGYFQLKFYAWLIFHNYPSVNAVKLREFYPRRTKARLIAVGRAQIEAIEEELRNVVLEMDRCLASGKPKRLKMDAIEPWNASPGKHCHWCIGKSRCPVPLPVREQYTVTSLERAQEAAAELEVLEAARVSLREALRPWAEDEGAIILKGSKGRRAFGLRTTSAGNPQLRFFTPEGEDRPPAPAEKDAGLKAAVDESVRSARAERDAA